MQTKFFKKAFCFLLFCVFAGNAVFATEYYTYRKIEAHSSQDNPGVLDITSTYESKDENGEVKKDSKTEQVEIPDNGAYRIKMNDDAGVTVEPVSEEELLESQQEFDRMFNDNFKIMQKHFDDISFDRFFDDDFSDNFFEKKITLPKIRHNVYVHRDAESQPASETYSEYSAYKKGYFENLMDWIRYIYK